MKNLAWKQIIITFAASFVLGTAFGRWEFSQQMHNRWKDPEARHQWILKRLDSGLNLNAEQEAQVAAILKEFSPKMEDVRAKTRPEMEALRQQIRERISSLLTPEQRQKYEQMEKEWQERKAKFR